MLSLPEFISSAFCRAQVIMKTKQKQISKTALWFISVWTKKADPLQVGSRVISSNHQYWRAQTHRACFKSGDMLMGTVVTGWAGQGTPTVAAWVGNLRQNIFITFTAQLKYWWQAQGVGGQIFIKINPLFKDDSERQRKKIRVYTFLWKINLVNLKDKRLSQLLQSVWDKPPLPPFQGRRLLCVCSCNSLIEQETFVEACGGLITVLFRVVRHPSSSRTSSVNRSLFSVSRIAFCCTSGSSEFISWIKLAGGEIRGESFKWGLQKEKVGSLERKV